MRGRVMGGGILPACPCWNPSGTAPFSFSSRLPPRTASRFLPVPARGMPSFPHGKRLATGGLDDTSSCPTMSIFLFARRVAHSRFPQVDDLLEGPCHARFLARRRSGEGRASARPGRAEARPSQTAGSAGAQPSRAGRHFREGMPASSVVPEGLLGHPAPEGRTLFRKMEICPVHPCRKGIGRNARRLALARRIECPFLARLNRGFHASCRQWRESEGKFHDRSHPVR